MLFLSPVLTAYILTVTALLGLVLGSFCNAWAWRIANGESIARGRSHCAACGHTLSARDLIPLVSWLLLRGKCRYCGAPISPRYPAAELISGLYYVSIVLRYDLSWDALRLLLMGSLLLTACLVDWDTMELPDGLLAAAALCALLRLPAEGLGALKSALPGAFAVSVPLLLFVLLADKVLGRESMGGGDIKLTAVLGLHFGPALSLLLLIAACVLGLLFALPRNRAADGVSRPFPFGPALGGAAWLTALFGAPILTWYLGLFL